MSQRIKFGVPWNEDFIGKAFFVGPMLLVASGKGK